MDFGALGHRALRFVAEHPYAVAGGTVAAAFVAYKAEAPAVLTGVLALGAAGAVGHAGMHATGEMTTASMLREYGGGAGSRTNPSWPAGPWSGRPWDPRPHARRSAAEIREERDAALAERDAMRTAKAAGQKVPGGARAIAEMTRTAKSLDYFLADAEKRERAGMLGNPVGGYPSFAACVRSKAHTPGVRDARRYCGAIEARARGVRNPSGLAAPRGAQVTVQPHTRTVEFFGFVASGEPDAAHRHATRVHAAREVADAVRASGLPVHWNGSEWVVACADARQCGEVARGVADALRARDVMPRVSA